MLAAHLLLCCNTAPSGYTVVLRLCSVEDSPRCLLDFIVSSRSLSIAESQTNPFNFECLHIQYLTSAQLHLAFFNNPRIRLE